jgi:hypothetical protein
MFIEFLWGFVLGIASPFYLPQLIDRSPLPEYTTTLLTLILSKYEKLRMENDRTDYVIDKLNVIENLIDRVYEKVDTDTNANRVVSPSH